MPDVPQHRQRNWEDRAVRDLLSEPENLQDLLRLTPATVVDHLDFSRMSDVRHKYVLPDLHELEEDVLVEVPFRQD